MKIKGTCNVKFDVGSGHFIWFPFSYSSNSNILRVLLINNRIIDIYEEDLKQKLNFK